MSIQLLSSSSSSSAPSSSSSSSSSSKTMSSVEHSTAWLSLIVFFMNSIFLIYFHIKTTNSESIISSLFTKDQTLLSLLSSSLSSISSLTTTSIPNATTTATMIYDVDNNDSLSIVGNTSSVSVSSSSSLHSNSSNVDIVQNSQQYYYYSYYYSNYYPNIDMILFTSLVVMAFEILDFITKNSGKWFYMSSIPVRGKHLDTLRMIDYYCIAFSKANTAPFTYLYLRYCYSNPETVIWDMNISSSLNISNTILPLISLFLLFDFSYSIFHGILHLQLLYPYIHKHHHIQKAPSRANVDAVNVHPIEFLGGEYNHLFVLYIYTKVLGCPIHIITAISFLVIGGILAGINHTRYDLTLSIPIPNMMKLLKSMKQQQQQQQQQHSSAATTTTTNYILYWIFYDSKAHDVHHRIPQSNYGQYFMLWDYLMGSYRPYNPNDRINPDAQLDPSTGRSLSSDSTKVKSL